MNKVSCFSAHDLKRNMIYATYRSYGRRMLLLRAMHCYFRYTGGILEYHLTESYS